MTSYGARYDLEPQQVFEGNYRIVRELGRGGFGVIYLAHQISMDRPVALKILKPGVGEHDPNAKTRFLREVRIISKLRHPNTVTIHDYGETVEGIVYMVLEYVEGHTMKALIKRDGAIKPMRALGFARQIARSLAEAHEHGIIHRDLKPANIMLTDLEGDSDFVKVLDFGIARLRDTEEVDLTRAGVPEDQRALIGTPRYMSPEQVRGEDLSPASDLYSLGLMLYEMLVGQPAVKGDTTMALISQQISPAPLALAEIDGLPPALQQLIRRATNKDVTQRLQSGNEFATAIDDTVQRIHATSGARGDADAREFLATSGRFSAISAPTPSRSAVDDAPSSPGAPHTPNPGEFQSTASNLHVDNATTDVRLRSSAQVQSAALASGAARTPASAEEEPLFPELNAPSNPAGQSAAQGDESRYFGVPSSQLPKPPDSAASPFIAEESAQEGDKKTDPEEEESGIAFAFKVAKLCFLGTVATFFVYISFLVVAALIAEYVDGYLRVAIAGGVAIAIPLFTALGENSQKERFEVVEKPSDRIARVFIGTTIFAAVPVVIMSFVMPGTILDELRNNPNWVFEPNPTVNYEPTAATEINERIVFAVADLIEDITTAVGVYDGATTEEDDPSPPPAFTPPASPSVTAGDEPPRPRRGGALATDPTPEEESESQNDADSDGDGDSDPGPPSNGDSADGDDDDYESW